MLKGLGQKAPQRVPGPYGSRPRVSSAAGGKRAPNPVVVPPAERGKPVVLPAFLVGKAPRKVRP